MLGNTEEGGSRATLEVPMQHLLSFDFQSIFRPVLFSALHRSCFSGRSVSVLEKNAVAEQDKQNLTLPRQVSTGSGDKARKFSWVVVLVFLLCLFFLSFACFKPLYLLSQSTRALETNGGSEQGTSKAPTRTIMIGDQSVVGIEGLMQKRFFCHVPTNFFKIF